MAGHQFCRDVCLERGEPLVGTGAFAARTILIAWPRGKWRVPRFESVDMGPPLASAIRRAMGTGIHVALVDRVGESDTVAQVQADGIAADYPNDVELAAAIDRFTDGTPLIGRTDPRPVILCCTDSRRDACCARYGFATFRALRAATDPARFNLLQCTHVGGCRFAASLIVLPQRQRYGRLDPAQVPAFLATIAAGQTYLPAFRGRTDLSEMAQVAEHAVLQWTHQRGLPAMEVDLGDGWQVDGDDHAGAEILRVVGTGPLRLRVGLQARLEPVHGKCTSLVDPPELLSRWYLTRIEQVAP